MSKKLSKYLGFRSRRYSRKWRKPFKKSSTNSSHWWHAGFNESGQMTKDFYIQRRKYDRGEF